MRPPRAEKIGVPQYQHSSIPRNISQPHSRTSHFRSSHKPDPASLFLYPLCSHKFNICAVIERLAVEFGLSDAALFGPVSRGVWADHEVLPDVRGSHPLALVAVSCLVECAGAWNEGFAVSAGIHGRGCPRCHVVQFSSEVVHGGGVVMAWTHFSRVRVGWKIFQLTSSSSSSSILIMAGPCRHCGAEWKSRIENPIQCPRCCQRLAMPTKRRRKGVGGDDAARDEGSGGQVQGGAGGEGAGVHRGKKSGGLSPLVPAPDDRAAGRESGCPLCGRPLIAWGSQNRCVDCGRNF